MDIHEGQRIRRRKLPEADLRSANFGARTLSGALKRRQCNQQEGRQSMRIHSIILTTACTIVLAAPGFAQTTRRAEQTTAPTAVANPQCSTLGSSIKRVVQNMGATQADGFLDNSAPRAAVRATEIASDQIEIQNYISLMSASRCAPYAGSISPDTYLLPAIKCSTDRTQASLTGQRDAKPASCERDNWVIEH